MCEELELSGPLRELARHVSVQDLQQCAISLGLGRRARDRLLALRAGEGGVRPGLLRWGLVGHFLDGEPRQPMITIDSEGLADRPFYNRLLADGRCAIPCRSFIATQRLGRRERLRLRYRAGRHGLLWLAGICDQHPLAGVTCALLSEAAPGDGPHEVRLPVVLGEAELAAWLGSGQDVALADYVALLQGRRRPSLKSEPIDTRQAPPQMGFDFT